MHPPKFHTSVFNSHSLVNVLCHVLDLSLQIRAVKVVSGFLLLQTMLLMEAYLPKSWLSPWNKFLYVNYMLTFKALNEYCQMSSRKGALISIPTSNVWERALPKQAMKSAQLLNASSFVNVLNSQNTTRLEQEQVYFVLFTGLTYLPRTVLSFFYPHYLQKTDTSVSHK